MRNAVRQIVVVSVLTVAVLGGCRPPAGEDATDWIESMRNGGGEARAEARQALIEMGPAAADALIDATLAEEDFIRWEAVNALGSLADDHLEAALPALPALVERVLVDRDSHTRWRSLWALSVFPEDVVQAEAIPLMREGLEQADAGIVWNAVVGLAYFREPDVAPFLNRGLSDNEGFARWEAVYCLHMVHDRDSLPLLTALITDTEAVEKSLRQEAAMTLGRIGDPQAVPALVAALRDPEAHVRWRAAAALAKLGAKDTVPDIEAALAQEQEEWAIEQMQAAIEQLRRAP